MSLCTYGEVIDLSSENRGKIDLGAAKASGVVALYLRGAFGRIDNVHRDIDSRVVELAKQAREVGLPFGTYNLGYVRSGKLQDTLTQAAHAINLAEQLGASLIVAHDWEHEKGDERATEGEFIDAIYRWKETAWAMQGRHALMYTGPGWWSLSKQRREWREIANVPLWSSDFEASRPIGQPLATPPWSRPVIHQYAGSPTATGRIGTCQGIDGYVDRSILLTPLMDLAL